MEIEIARELLSFGWFLWNLKVLFNDVDEF